MNRAGRMLSVALFCAQGERLRQGNLVHMKQAVDLSLFLRFLNGICCMLATQHGRLHEWTFKRN